MATFITIITNTITFLLLAVLHHHETVYLALNQNLIEAITARYVVKYPIQKALRSDYHLIDIPRPIYKEPLSCYSLLLLLLGNN